MTIFLTQANMSPERALEGWLLLQEAYPDRYIVTSISIITVNWFVFEDVDNLRIFVSACLGLVRLVFLLQLEIIIWELSQLPLLLYLHEIWHPRNHWKNDHIYLDSWWVLALLWSRMERWSGLTSKFCICCAILVYPILGYVMLSCCQF